MTQAEPPALNNDPHSELWAVLRHFFGCAQRDIGDPTDIARIALIGPEARKLILDWLAPLEALLRRLLFLNAVAIELPNAPHPNPAKLKAPKPNATPARPKVARDAENPASWPAHFRLAPPSAHRPAPSSPQNAPPKNPRRGAHFGAGLYTGWPLALRFEALRRAMENPDALTLRLARLLRARPACARAFTQPPRAQEHWRFAAHYVAIATDLAADAAAPFPDTG
jgi:hypothetical protein